MKIQLKKIISECVDKYLCEHMPNTFIDVKYLYHATPSCYVNSIKKYGLGGKLPKMRLWDYKGTPYEKSTQGCFLATDEYVAESYVENSEYFEELSDLYEEKYDKELGITVFRININDLNPNLLSIDSNQLIDDDTDPTYFYDGVIPYNQLTKINLYEDKTFGNFKNKINETLNNVDYSLYHNTSLKNLISMMKTNSIESNFHRGYTDGQIQNGICFTRNPIYNPYSQYNVRITFDANKLKNIARGLTLIPYKDNSHKNIDEFEERLVSKNNEKFTLPHLNEIVTDVVINIKPIELKILKGNSPIPYISDLEFIYDNNIFGDKLRISYGLQNYKEMTFSQTIKLLYDYDDVYDDD